MAQTIFRRLKTCLWGLWYKTNNWCASIVNILSDISLLLISSSLLISWFSSSRQLCQTVKELLTLTGSDEAVQADVFLFALGETASLTLSWLILGLGLSQRQCLYLPLHTLSLEDGHACNYGCVLKSWLFLGVTFIPQRAFTRCCSLCADHGFCRAQAGSLRCMNSAWFWLRHGHIPAALPHTCWKHTQASSAPLSAIIKAVEPPFLCPLKDTAGFNLLRAALLLPASVV